MTFQNLSQKMFYKRENFTAMHTSIPHKPHSQNSLAAAAK